MTMPGDARSSPAIVQNRLLPATTLAVLVVFCMLYCLDAHLYLRVLSQWSFLVDGHPFLDTEFVTAQISCWGKGIDVYRVNPCDLYGRVHVYSPLWLRMGFLPPGEHWGKILGVAQDLLFIASLTFLPAVPGRRGAIVLMAAALSPAILFAMERGNIDLAMFALAVTGLALLERSRMFRIAGYGCFLIAGLLKFYPLILFGRALDERPRIFVAIAAVSSLAVAAFGIAYAHEIPLAFANMPTPSDFGDGFSARQLGDGLGQLLFAPRLGRYVTPVLSVACLTAAARLAARPGLGVAFSALSPRASSCLVAGALLFCGCFFTGPSVGYRGMVLLLTLPGCVLMAQAAMDARSSRSMWITVLAMLAGLWNFVPMMALGAKAPLGRSFGPLPFLAAWLCREAAWWVVATVLLSVLLRFAATSVVGKDWVGRAFPPRAIG